MNTYTAPTLNTSSFKISSVLPYVLVITLLSLLCLGLERQAKDVVKERDIAIAKTIANDFLQMEKQINISLNNATMTLEAYLEKNPQPTRKQLIELSKEFSVSSLSVYSAKTGRLEYTSASGLQNPDRKEFFKTYSILNTPFFAKMKEEDNKVIFGPLLKNEANDNQPRKVVTRYSKKLNNFITARYKGVDLEKILANSVNVNKDIYSTSIFAPSGKIILKFASNDVKPLDMQMPKYKEDAEVNYADGNINVLFSFGGIKQSGSAKNFGLTVDGSDEYFYNIAVTFGANGLEKQLWFLRITFTVIGLFACIAIHYINKSMQQSNQLADLSERMGDKVTNLCNTRLGEVRRYVTKIVKDSMRVDNMNKELPEEIVQLLNRAFREVDEKALTNAKIDIDSSADTNADAE